jgi:hypothetical protein
MHKSQQRNTERAMKLSRFVVNDRFTKLKSDMNYEYIEILNKPELTYDGNIGVYGGCCL